ncbi:MAG: hypothetical protein BGO01_10015 [Armatimonadetes bacterium 55-13]|nr:Crp/Fnr family transcriptional regulator [Armatimonadota bacterium]OJU62734.1 MAG: hypothetical protein BGO01_10015 [Armatimonadetes bacterium 55-13]
MAVDIHRLWYLRNVDLFRNLPPPAQEELVKSSSIVEFKRGDEVCTAGVGHERAYIVKEGNVRLIVHSPNGKKLTVAILKPGDLIGGADLFHSETVGESAEAMSACVLYSLPIQILRRFANDHLEFAVRITKEIDKSRTLILNRMQDILFLTVPERLARLFLRLADQFPGTTKSGKRFLNLRLTHQEIADLIGANREAVSAALIGLRREKCVSAVQGYIVLNHEESLRKSAHVD